MFIYFLYRLLGALAFPLILLYFLKRGLRDSRYWKGLGERFGQGPASLDTTIPGGIWLHAVSVGEVVSAVELLRRLRAQSPATPLFVSVTTVAGRQLAEDRLGQIVDGIFYSPIDVCWIVRRVFRRLRPRLLVVMETEIWPNLYREAKRFGCGLVIVNGRISDRAIPTYRRWRWVFQEVLRWPDRILAQNQQAADRYAELGAPLDRLEIAGNLKYDFQIRDNEIPEAVRAFVDACMPGHIWIAASTMPPFEEGDPDEDDAVIAAFEQLSREFPKLLLILVPRRPERFETAAAKLASAGVRFVRRSGITEGNEFPLPGVLLLDTIGELSSIFPLASVVFMGGTLPHRGGHNILEPAFAAKPVIIGPHMENFPDIAEEFRGQKCVVCIDSPRELGPAVARLLQDEAAAAGLGQRAKTLAESKRGAVTRALDAIQEAHRNSVPRRHRTIVARMFLWPLSRLWRLGLTLDRSRKLRQRQKVSAPVVSIGGLAMGGTGKTPLVGYLAEHLASRGLRPAILTRGYRRGSPEKQTIVLPGEECCTARTGDEGQILLRAGHAALGIGADRAMSARMLQERWKPGVFLLDDGLQHWRLARDVELIVIDAIDPFAGGVFPLGRLREPLSALRRASCFLVTRSGPDSWPGLEDRLRRYQPSAPVFYCRTVPLEWVSISGERVEPLTALPHQEVAAFCGLGNPASFWKTLKELDLRPRFQWAFGDHESYRPRQLQRLRTQAAASGATALLMTEKDFVNLPRETPHLLQGVSAYWLRMRFEIDAEERFWNWLVPRLVPRQ
ncbi:MAG: tetraacyldisaccharide 4'-kinase [Bryobacterales bacterium]|nr:tetraacyldisaccharide 4'-kinase [Bryobacterales bacterium]